jgi:hypothetical protein
MESLSLRSSSSSSFTVTAILIHTGQTLSGTVGIIMLSIDRRLRIQMIKAQLVLCRMEDSRLTRELEGGQLNIFANDSTRRSRASLHDRMRKLYGQLEIEVGKLPTCDSIREAIVATLNTLAAGRITAKELPISPDTRKDHIRYAPGFGRGLPATQVIECPYTVDGLAKFLGGGKSRDL